jgi:hypothetical protein
MLSGKGITGSIPFELTKLPALVELYVMIIPFFFLFSLLSHAYMNLSLHNYPYKCMLFISHLRWFLSLSLLVHEIW